MKKIASVLGAVILALVLLAGLAVPAAAANETWVVASTSGVNLRKSATTGSSVLGVLALGSTITVSKKAQGGGVSWGYVSSAKPAKGSWGKSSGGWVSLDPCMQGSPTKWTAQNSLNLRGKADAKSSRLALLPKNTTVVVTTIVKQGGYTWGRVAYAKAPNNEYWMRMGWVALDYCKKTS